MADCHRGALGRRRRSDGPESVALAALLRDSDLKVAAAAAIASGSIGTPRDVETLWDEARKARKELLPALHEAILLGASGCASGVRRTRRGRLTGRSMPRPPIRW